MPAAFATWTVLPHNPIEVLAPNLWRVEGSMPSGSVRRVMTVARLQDGRLLLHNAIALDEAEMERLDAFGEVAGILVPNGFHRQDAAIMKARYPKAQVYCPSGSRARVEKVVAVDGDYDAVPRDPTVQTRPLAGFPAEGVLLVTSDDGVTAVFCDAVMFTSAKARFPISTFLAPLGRMAVPRATRWFFTKDNAALKGDLERIAATDGLRRIIGGHGRMVDQDAAPALRLAAGDCG